MCNFINSIDLFDKSLNESKIKLSRILLLSFKDINWLDVVDRETSTFVVANI